MKNSCSSHCPFIVMWELIVCFCNENLDTSENRCSCHINIQFLTSVHLDLNCDGAEVVLFFIMIKKSISHRSAATIFATGSFASWISQVLMLKNKIVEKCQPNVFPTIQILEILNTPSYITKKNKKDSVSSYKTFGKTSHRANVRTNLEGKCRNCEV